MGENSRGDTPTLSIAGSKEKKLPAGMKESNKQAYAIDAVGRYEPLFAKDILELSIVVIGKFQVVRFLDGDPFSIGFSNAPAAGALHVGKELILVEGEVQLKTVVEPRLNPKAAEIGFRHVSVHHLQMDAS